MMKYIQPLLMFILALVIIGNIYWPNPLLQFAINGLASVLFFWFLRDSKGVLLVTLLTLFMAGTVIFFVYGASTTVILNGFSMNAEIVSLFILIPLFGLPILAGGFAKSVEELFDTFVRKPSQYYLVSKLISHVVTLVLNMGGITLIQQITERREKQWLGYQIRGITRGFSYSLVWSPYYSGIAMMILYFDLSWSSIFMAGLPLVLLGIILGWALEIMSQHYNRDAAFHNSGMSPSKQLRARLSEDARHKFLQLIAGIVLVTLFIMIMERFSDYSVVTLVNTLSLFMPYVFFVLLKKRKLFVQYFKEQYFYGRLMNSKSEVALFIIVGYFGAAIQNSPLTVYLADFWGQVSSVSPVLFLCFIFVIVIVLSVSGIHPFVVVFTMTLTLSSQAFAFEPLIIAVSLLQCWGLAMLVSPFSGPSLMLSNQCNLSTLQISLKWNWLYVLIHLGLSVAYLLILGELT